MGKQNGDSEFTTLHVRTATSKMVKNKLNKLVSAELGVSVKGHDSVAYAVKEAINKLKTKHPNIVTDEN